MNTNFRFGGDVADTLAGAQLGRLRSILKGMIARLVQREEWASMVIALMPELPRVMHPEFFARHYFDFHTRSFVLAYDAGEECWILNFAKKPNENPPTDAEAQGGGAPQPQEPRVEREQPADRRRGPRRAAMEALSAAKLAALNVARRTSHMLVDAAHRTEDVLDEVCDRLAQWSDQLCEAARDHLLRTKAATEDRRARFMALCAELRAEFENAAMMEHRDGAHLEQRTVTIAPGVEVKVNTFVPDHIDWDSFPFGEPNQEEHALA